jgi:hypothetical protein
MLYHFYQEKTIEVLDKWMDFTEKHPQGDLVTVNVDGENRDLRVYAQCQMGYYPPSSEFPMSEEEQKVLDGLVDLGLMEKKESVLELPPKTEYPPKGVSCFLDFVDVKTKKTAESRFLILEDTDRKIDFSLRPILRTYLSGELEVWTDTNMPDFMKIHAKLLNLPLKEEEAPCFMWDGTLTCPTTVNKKGKGVYEQLAKNS